MFCSKCGFKHSDNSRFCPRCGQPIEGAAPVQQAPVQPVQQKIVNQAPVQPAPMQQMPMQGTPMQQAPVQGTPMQQVPVQGAPMQQVPVQGAPMQPAKAKKKFPIIPVVIAAAVVAAIVTVLLIILNQKVKINVGDYVSVQFNGYDTVGNAELVFDNVAFVEKYSGKIKSNESDEDKEEAVNNLANYLNRSLYIDKENNLKNGDEVSIKQYNDIQELEDIYNIKISFEEQSYEVSGLKDVKTINPFDDVTVTFSGTNGSGTATVIYNGNYNLDFYIGDSYNLSTGDDVVVTAYYNYSEADANSLINEGVLLSKTSETYTVDQLAYYGTSFADIPQDVFEELQNKTIEILKNDYNWESNDVVLSAYDYSGCYLLVSKDMDSTYLKNSIYMVYVYELTPSDYDVRTYGFAGAKFDNVIVNPDGSYEIDVNNYQRFNKRVEAHYGKGKYDYFMAPGYRTFEEFEADCIKPYLSSYDYSKFIRQ